MSQGRWQTTLERLNRFELRNAIEFIPLVRIEAWQLLLQKKPTIHELAHVAAKVEFLQDAAWKLLLGQAPTIDLLKHFADRFEELRGLVWTELTRQNVPFDKLWWVQVPSDDSSQSRIWNHLVANHYDSLLSALKWLPLYDDNHDRFPIWRIAIKSNRLNALTTDIEARLAFWHAGYLLLGSGSEYATTIESELDRDLLVAYACEHFSIAAFNRLLATNNRIADLICTQTIDAGGEGLVEMLDLANVDRLFQIMHNCPRYRWQAWQKITDIRAKKGYGEFRIPLDFEDPSVVDEIWQSLFNASFDTHDLLFRTWPRQKFVELAQRDKDRLRGRLSRHLLGELMIKDDHFPFGSLECRSQFVEFVFGMILDNSSGSRRAKEAWHLLKWAYQAELHAVDLAGSPSAQRAIEEIHASVQSIGINWFVEKLGSVSSLLHLLIPIMHCDSQTRENLEAELLRLCRSDQDLEELARIAKSKSVRLAAWHLLDKSDNATQTLTIHLAKQHPEFAETAWQLILDSGDKKRIWEILPNIPCSPEKVIEDLQARFELEDNDLVWLMRYFPNCAVHISKFLSFDSGHSGCLHFVDTANPDDAVELEFDVNGCVLNRQTIVGKSYVFGYSIDPLFDEDWWTVGSASLVSSLITAANTLPLADSSDIERRAERALNNAFKHPDFRSVQVIKFHSEAWIEVEVEKSDGTIVGGFITWPNSD